MSILASHEELIQNMVARGLSDQQISDYLITEIQIRRGASERSVRQFRIDRGLVRKTVSDPELEVAVSQAILEVSLFSNRYSRE